MGERVKQDHMNQRDYFWNTLVTVLGNFRERHDHMDAWLLLSASRPRSIASRDLIVKDGVVYTVGFGEEGEAYNVEPIQIACMCPGLIEQELKINLH